MVSTEVTGVCWFPGTAVTKHHKGGGLKQQKFILYKSSRGKNQAQSQGQQDHAPFETCEEEFLLPSSGFRCLLTTLNIPCLTDTSLQPVSLSLQGVLPGVSLPPYEDNSHIGLRTYPTSMT